MEVHRLFQFCRSGDQSQARGFDDVTRPGPFRRGKSRIIQGARPAVGMTAARDRRMKGNFL